MGGGAGRQCTSRQSARALCCRNLCKTSPMSSNDSPLQLARTQLLWLVLVHKLINHSQPRTFSALPFAPNLGVNGSMEEKDSAVVELLLGTPQPSVQQAQQLWQAALSAHASQTNTECLAKQAKDLQTDCKSSASLSLASPSSALPAHRILEQTLSMSVHPEKYLTTHTNCTYIYSHAVERHMVAQ